MKVYHGGSVEIIDIDLSRCELYHDFGKGFYVTNIREQAEFWAERKGGDNHPGGHVTEFDFVEAAFEHWNFKALRFEDYSREWLDFVVMNRDRSRPVPAHDYDIVEGPVADDKIAQRARLCVKGIVSRETFLEELKFAKHTHQICFCTHQSLQALEAVRAPARIIIDIDEAVAGSLVNNFGMSEEEAVDHYYASRTYGKLIDESTGLYLRPWREIYDMLLAELKLK
ncbi:MAG: DUF3990 domain-containing protein [Odoribacteraceae bacterium]|jgi:hypothetical protein|nr:DUF3990 domain-containing protein [Odoribacteraceae bacterium]